MRRLKSFRNWLGYVYSVCWALRQQFVVHSSPAEQRAAEEEHSAAIVAKTATPPEKLPEQTVTEKERVALIAETKKVLTPAQKVAEVPKRVPQPRVSQPLVPQPTVSQQPASQPPVASAPVAVSSPKTQPQKTLQAPQALQTTSANVNGQATNGAIGSPSGRGKYDPGAVNDQTAQRLARLLVSEIKLYYKSKTDGENGSESINIYDVLKDPIDKSRRHYQARMGEKAIKAMPDYFHGELVRTLCGGDPSRLGPNYQPSVERT